MSKYVLSLLLLMIAGTAMCQKKSKVNLVSSTKSVRDKHNGVDNIKVYNGSWTQDFSKMRSDSAYFYPEQNAFDAFGHVVINQGDTLNIFADKLHYDGNTKIAVLTDNVIMVDKDATLTTNFFTYNTATRIGTYTDGGKIVNKGNTLTSKNGYYFAGTHDAYFRYNVVCVTSDALIHTDTMRYNSKTRINYFYGPTHIYGTKDKDTLDTEFGTYDTNTEQAFFTKKNLYRQGTKSLTGDTLFYDRIKGYGRAVKHVIFNDNEQKVTIKGGLGTYFKKNDLTIVTRDPYVILVTDKDSTDKDTSAVKPLAAAKKDSLNKNAAVKNAIAVAGNKQVQQQIKTGLLVNNLSPAQSRMIDTAIKKLPVTGDLHALPGLPMPGNIDTAKKMAAAQIKKTDKGTQKKLNMVLKNIPLPKPDTNNIIANNPLMAKDTGNRKHDSVYMSADTIETRILTFKELKKIQELERLSHIRDTTLKVKRVPIVYKKAPKFLSVPPPKLPKDTLDLHSGYFGLPKPKPVKPKKIIKQDTTTSVKKKMKIDSTFLDRDVVLSDTSRVRIIMAFHSGKIFKSDLQAKADSIFYSNSDSTIRCYTKPMLWTQGSQISGDTIFMQMKNKKLDNMYVYPPAFIVNVEKGDSTHFNQVGGKKMRGFFKNSKLNRVYVDGNAESIYFVRDSTTNEVTDMQRSFSSRMRIYLKNSEVTDLAFLTKADNRYIPIEKVKEDDKILKNFIWKPKDRPISKESIIPSYNKKPDTVKTAPVAGLPRPKKMYGAKTVKKDTVNNKTRAVVNQAAQDSTLNAAEQKLAKDTSSAKNTILKTPAKFVPRMSIKAKRDSLLKTQPLKPGIPNTGKDTSQNKLPLPNSPVIQTKKDTTVNK